MVLHTDYREPDAAAGWVKIRVHATSVNFHDIFTRRGMPGIAVPLPLIIGSDIAGTVAALGDGVEDFTVGDRVLIDPHPNSHTSGRFIGEQFDGGRAEYCVAHSSQLIQLSDAVSFEEAAAIPLAYATAHRMIRTKGQVASGETVLILGASGGVGTACVLLAKHYGANVIACGSSADKLARTAALGADHLINYRENDLRTAVWNIAGKPRLPGTGGVDMVINFTGGGTWGDSIRCLKKGGRLLTCGATQGFEETVDVRYVWSFEHTIQGSNGWDRSDIETLLGMVESGSVRPVIDRVLPLEQAQEAERLLEDREVFGKIVLRP